MVRDDSVIFVVVIEPRLGRARRARAADDPRVGRARRLCHRSRRLHGGHRDRAEDETIEIQFPNTRPDPGLEVEDDFCDANAAAHQVGTPAYRTRRPATLRGGAPGVNIVCVDSRECVATVA